MHPPERTLNRARQVDLHENASYPGFSVSYPLIGFHKGPMGIFLFHSKEIALSLTLLAMTGGAGGKELLEIIEKLQRIVLTNVEGFAI